MRINVAVLSLLLLQTTHIQSMEDEIALENDIAEDVAEFALEELPSLRVSSVFATFLLVNLYVATQGKIPKTCHNKPQLRAVLVEAKYYDTHIPPESSDAVSNVAFSSICNTHAAPTNNTGKDSYLSHVLELEVSHHQRKHQQQNHTHEIRKAQKSSGKGNKNVSGKKFKGR